MLSQRREVTSIEEGSSRAAFFDGVPIPRPPSLAGKKTMCTPGH